MKAAMLIIIIAGVAGKPVEIDSITQCEAIADAVVAIWKATGAEESILAVCTEGGAEI